jgi:hypothetical protein
MAAMRAVFVNDMPTSLSAFTFQMHWFSRLYKDLCPLLEELGLEFSGEFSLNMFQRSKM